MIHGFLRNLDIFITITKEMRRMDYITPYGMCE